VASDKLAKRLDLIEQAVTEAIAGLSAAFSDEEGRIVGFWASACRRRVTGFGPTDEASTHGASSGPVVAGLGTKAISATTPVATTPAKIAEICTRTPVDRIHYISLDTVGLRHRCAGVTWFRSVGPVTAPEIESALQSLL